MGLKKLRKNSIKMNLKWFLNTIVVFRYHNSVFWFPLGRKKLNHNPTEFTDRIQVAAYDQWTRQDKKFLIQKYT